MNQIERRKKIIEDLRMLLKGELKNKEHLLLFIMKKYNVARRTALEYLAVACAPRTIQKCLK